MRTLFSALLLFPFLFSKAQTSILSQQENLLFPDSSWVYEKNPALMGWNNEKLDGLRNFIADSANTTGMMVIQHGKVIFSYGDIKEVSYIASCRKSILSMLYGPFVESGKINLNQSLADLNIDDVGGLLPIEKKATIRDLLTSRSGVYHVASYQGDEYLIAPNRGTVKPGSLFLYNNWDFNLAGFVFEKLTHTGIYKAIDSILAHPLQMEDWDLKIQHKEGDSTQSLYPAYPMWFSTRDMARIGYLMLREGKWNGQQIISKDWVHKITSPFTPFKAAATYRDKTYTDFGYGYLWWVWDRPDHHEAYKNAYSAQGYFGQYITVLPALDLVIAHKTNDKYERATNNYFKIVDQLIAANDSISKNKVPKLSLTKSFPIKKETLKKYTGEYQLPFNNRTLTAFYEKDTFFIQSTGNKMFPIRPLSDSTFTIDDSSTTFHFTDIKNGKATNLVINERGNPFTAYRILRPTELVLKQYAGTYRNAGLEANYKIFLKNKALCLLHTDLNDTLQIHNVSKDVFVAKKQEIKFKRSADSKQVIGFSMATRSLKDEDFIKVPDLK